MTKRVKPTEAEFVVLDDEVKHIPTGAIWSAYPGHREASHYRPVMLGSVLPNGDDYRPDEVKVIALHLLANRPGVKG